MRINTSTKVAISCMLLQLTSIAQSQILLPVEVIGEHGKVVTRSLVLSQEMADASDRLWLQVNNLSYENKASVRINDGAWLDLNHETVEMQHQEAARGGMVHGGFNTIRFSVPVSGFQAGENTLRFRFNHSDGISNGFRVVRLNLLDANGLKLLSPTQFVEDDPDTWQPPYPDEQSIAEGKDLWYNADLWSNYLEPGTSGFWYGAELQAFQPIKASCADCHTQDGRDLELFAYSNESIIERAKFHNLSEEEGKKIASYIRSLSGTYENVNRHGRPWNPPYQPGPQLEGKSIEYWAAGAGLDAVLDEDADMAEYMFPDGISADAVADRFDSDKMVDRTQLPLAIQLPDWKHWLPIIHPMDAFANNGFYDDPQTEYTPARAYPAYREFLESSSPFGPADADRLMDEIKVFWRNFRFFLSQGADEGIGEHWRADDGDARTIGLIDDQLLELAATSLGRLLAVKNFEVVQEFDLQDKSEWFADPVDQPAARQWFGDMYQVFEIPPHFTGCVFNDCQQFTGQPTATGQYESTSWYHLQSIVNGGNGMMSHNSPVDYNYQQQYVLLASNSSGVYEPLRYYHALNTMYQTRTWSGATTPNDGKGFRIRVQGPWQFMGKEADAGRSQFHGFAPGFWPTLLDRVDKGLTKWVLDAQMRQFLQEVHKPENSLDTWERYVSGNESNVLDPIEKTQVKNVEGSLEAFTRVGPHWADHMYWTIQQAVDFGVDCHLIDSLIDWSKAAWPNIVQYEDRVTTEAHLFDELRQTSTPTLQLKVVTRDDCSKEVQALPANGGDQPAYVWYVKGVEVGETTATLSSADFAAGDKIRCVMTSNQDCVKAGVDTAESSLTVLPDLDLSLTKSLNGVDISSQNTIQANDGDVLTFAVEASQHPSAFFEPVLWLDAMDIGTDLSGDEVISWNDLSPNANNAAALGTDLRPKYDAAGFNGLPAVMFGQNDDADGLELFSTAEDDFFEDEWTIIMVGANYLMGNWTNTIGNKNTPAGDGWFFRFSDAGRIQLSAGEGQDNGGTYSDGYSFIATLSRTGSELSLAVNGRRAEASAAQGVEALTNTTSISLGVVGSQGASTTRYHKGPVSEVLVFDRELTAEELAFLEGYLASKWKLENAQALAEASPLNMTMTAPGGERIQLNTSTSSYDMSLSAPGMFADYVFTKNACPQPFDTLKVVQNVALDDQVFSIDENSSIGTSVGTVAASASATLSYEIAHGNENQIFFIDAEKGEVSVTDAEALDYETSPFFSLIVQVRDDSNNQSSATISVALRDVNEAPVVARPIERQVLGQIGSASFDLREVFADPEGQLLSYSAISDNPAILAVEMTEADELKLSSVSKGTTEVIVTAADEEGLSTKFSFEVEVTDIILSAGPTEEPLAVYPNPGNGHFYLYHPASTNGTGILSVTDLAGRGVPFVKKTIDQTHQSLDLLDSPPGIYFMRVNVGGSVVVKRIIKR